MAKNIIILMIRRGLGALISILGTTMIVKNLTVEDYGIYSIFLNIISLSSTFATLGVDAATGYVLQNKKYKPENALINTFCLGAILSVVSFLIFSLIFYNLHLSDFNMIPHNIKMYMVISSVGMLFSNILFSILMGSMDFKNYSIFTILPNLTLATSLAISIKFFNLTLEKTALFFMLGYIISSISLIIFLSVRYNIFNNLRFFSSEISRYIFRYGFQSYLSNIVTFLNYRINIFIIGYFLGSKDVGFYSTCLVIVDFIWLLSSTMSSITYPLFSNPSVKHLRKKLIPIITRTILLFTTIATFAFYILSDYLIPLLFGEKFLLIKNLILILAPGVILLGGAKIISADYTAQGKPKMNIYLNVMALIITIVTNIIFIPRLGLQGAALATSISFGTLFITSLVVYCKMTDTRIISYLVPKLDDLKMILKANH
ncbi:oligosaccharide flippase family protein [Chryseobacterium sp. MHB01]|uniref:oligosaccharide flippase family protein n=1 Tax=Chryseobacterium sp. MHB01 TaxID=3109433 RepID=UPI002AFF1886|nr:oligosaccharide flippase family protein [Chryseobacterium sp. MHB01]MEA1850868.1 oligosaccharide flippase family protein [Chryseobacterium sp. MHB01]